MGPAPPGAGKRWRASLEGDTPWSCPVLLVGLTWWSEAATLLHQPRPPAPVLQSGGSKPATLETGAVIQVPLFIAQGERIKVDTRTDSYLSRAS